MHRLLLVEDEPELRELVAECLRDKYALECAATLSEAKRHLESNRFDLILLDVTLPDGDGLVFGEAFLLNSGRAVPIVYLTGHPEIRQRIPLTPGLRECLVKPYRIADLLECTAALLKKKPKREAV